MDFSSFRLHSDNGELNYPDKVFIQKRVIR